MTIHLLHIGCPKTGSNFLRRWFARHPQIAFAHGGVAGVHDVYALATEAAGGGERALCRATSCEALSMPHREAGSASVDYGAMTARSLAEGQAHACALLRDLFPSAVVLIVTRGHRAMLLSAYSQYLRTGGGLDFAQFCTASAGNPDGDPWDYDRLVGLYEAAFGAEQLLVLPYELLREDPDRFTAVLEARLGLGRCAAERAEVNASVSGAALAWYPRFAGWAARFPRLGRIHRRALAGGRLERAAAVLQRLRPRPVPSEADIPEATLAAYAGRAERLRHRALYRPYLGLYLMGENP